MPIQWVNRFGIDFRGFSGLIESGDVSVGQNVVVSPSGETATVKEIVFFIRINFTEQVAVVL